jgi:hypothetical protein
MIHLGENVGSLSSKSKRSRATSNAATHRLKCWPVFFEPVRAGVKTHDLRRADDRDFSVGDRILLEEYNPETQSYTGRTVVVQITYITSADVPCALSQDALHPDFCILSIALCE